MPRPVIDLHEDISFYYITGASGLGFDLSQFSFDMPGRHADIPKFKKGNVKVVFGSSSPITYTFNPRVSKQLSNEYSFPLEYSRAYSPRSSSSALLEHVKVYYNLCNSYPQDLYIVRRKRDLDDAIKKNGTSILISLEGADAVEDVEDIKILYNIGIRAIGFTWNFDNRYAACCTSRKDYGLTGEGEDLLHEMNDFGIIPDLAHSSKNTCVDVLQVSKEPIVVSHTAAMSIYNSVRNLDDEILETLHKNGGVMGFIFGKPMIGGTEDVNQLAKHIMYVYNNFGPDILAIGSDYFGLIDITAPRGIEDISKLENLWRILIEQGMKEDDIDMLSYKNAYRVIEANAEHWKDFA
ncbi:MAG: membrane dipeptidase [Nitrososphaeria archaeon]|jgi:membrane dipeptidase